MTSQSDTNIFNTPTVERMAYGFRKVGQREDKIQVQRTVEEPKALSELLRIGEKMVDEYSDKIFRANKLDFYVQAGEYTRIYTQMLADTVKAIKLSYTPQDIETFITVKGQAHQQEREEQALGMYTGCLLEALTARNAKRGIHTLMHLKERSMNYLFYCIRNADTIILEKFYGSFGLNNAAKCGKISAVVLNDVDMICSLENIAGYEGRLNLLVINKSKLASETGKTAARNKGSIDMIIAKEVDSNGSFLYNATIGNGWIKLLVAESVSSFSFLADKLHEIDLSDELGRINLVMTRNCDILDFSRTKIIPRVTIINNDIDPERYNKMAKALMLNTIFSAVDKLAGKPAEEQVKYLDWIYSVYAQVAKNAGWK